MEHKPLYKQKLELKDLKKEPAKVFKKLTCPACDTPIPADNININDKIAKCGGCDAIFPFHEAVSEFTNIASIKQEVIRPEGIDLIHFQDELDITLDQPAPVLSYMGIFFFSFFSILSTLIYLKKGISIIIPGVIWLTTAYFLYNVLNRHKNKIHINIDQNNLTIKWRPKKGMKDRVIDVQEIDQVYLKTDSANYYLFLILNGIEGQKHVPLIKGWRTTLGKARYLEQEIEKHLGIKDRKVPESNVNV